MFKKFIIFQLFILIFLFSNSKVLFAAETEDFAIWLSNFQQKALAEIETSFAEKEVCLLNGIISSGKTEV